MNLEQVRAAWTKRCATLADEIRAKRRCDICIANALWSDKRFPLRKEYVDTIAASYRTGGVIPADFSNPEASRQMINQWAQTQTKDKIEDLIPKNEVDDNTRLVLTNAIYFKGQWASQFDPKYTRDGNFFVTSDRQVNARMMTGRMTCRYVADKDMQAIELPYADGNMGMVIILPRSKDGLAILEKSLSPEVFAAWLGRMHETTVSVHLPRFTISGASKDLGETLRAMGMTDAFDYRRANFTGMTDSGGPYAIGKVFHQGRIEVTEEGTVAAAATAVTMTLGGSPPAFNADHPFFFVIRDIKTGTIAFMGHVAEPTL
jgi:serpin B